MTVEDHSRPQARDDIPDSGQGPTSALESNEREVVAWRVELKREPQRDQLIYDRIMKMLSTSNWSEERESGPDLARPASAV